MPVPPLVARALAHAVLNEDEKEILRKVRVPDAGHGYDAFGLHRDFVALGMALGKPLYKRYFRCISYGAENIPRTGPGVLAANHSGTLPTDGMMLWMDVIQQAGRVPRPIADHFVPTLPVLGTFFSRGGMVGGSRGNARTLLDAGELLMIFPEGTPGIGKHYRDRYHLQRWRVGHTELAIRHGAPIVPVAFIGPEEQMPQIGRLDRLGRLLGLPYVPIPATPLPMPFRYHIHYGKPLPFKDMTPSDADDPDRLEEAAQRVREAVDHLIRKGLKKRKGRLFS